METKVLVKLPEDLKKRILDYAALTSLTPGQVIVLMIRYALASDDGLLDGL
jgi:hypothetical protein